MGETNSKQGRKDTGGKISKSDKGADKTKTTKKRVTKEVPRERVKHNPEEDISKYYELSDKVLGLGNFSTVKLGVEKETKMRVAIKIVDKTGVKHKPEMLKNEVEILLKIDHPNIVKLLDLFDSEKSLFLVMELVTGGELFDRIVEREQYSEADAREVMRQLFSATEYIHAKGIVHRDLKPENLLLETTDDDTTIKMTDFGLSKIYSEAMLATACGTPGYVAPEILKCQGYDTAVDMWSCGVIMYILLCGYPPFYSENDAVLFESIMAATYHFHSPYWDNISTEAKDLIKKLLVVDPGMRLTAPQALQDPWLKISYSEKAPALPSEMKKQLEQHNSYRKSKISVTNSQPQK